VKVASALIVWSDMIRGDSVVATLDYGFGIPGLLLTFVFWQACWAAAGFVLGALWRQLPGRRGPMKALLVSVAFALPIGVDALGNEITDEAMPGLALYASAMLLVLSITGITMDLATFHSERRYWQSGLGLLFSVYQMRSFSLQMASLLAQAIAFITIWQFFVDSNGAPIPEPSSQSDPGQDSDEP
jgi:hypothetical protein